MPRSRGQSRGSHPKTLNSRSTPIGRGSSSIVGRGREIADEWSPRGRGSNSTGGNGSDVRDESRPRGRGSNNTCGNSRGRANEGSPIGRGCSSIDGRGNETADEWCPSPDILGNERLEVHTDNEEHVEHVTDSSQNQVGSNVIPSSSLPKLWLIGGVFYDPAISRHAVKLFKTMFKGAYATWTQVPKDHRDRCFNRFGTFYRWDAAESNQIRDAWESHIGKRYPDIMRGVRKAAMKVKRVNNNVDIGRISSSRPIWISENNWLPMVEAWDTDEWRLKSKTAQENRAKSQSGKHTAGSRSFLHTKIVMENKTGRRVKLVELHTRVHTRKGTKPGEPGSSGTAEFVDPMAKQRMDDYSRLISEKHVENEENAEIDESGSKSPPDDFDVWKGVATSDRGHVLGAGSTKDPTFVLTGIPGSGSIYATHMCSPYEEIRILKKQNDDLKKKMEDERVAADVQRAADTLAWHKTLNDRFESFAQNYPPRTERPTESDPGPS